ncbi:alpha/beta fold hydrolase [Parerythrobacter lacustris]|uniref:Alpha/beta hydrolase n=1 Tax=Parerythrobacter lacustris TaxID=2969984 RepID=A0ABT1XWE3_9SPHN|nr:alpha/beta hydrolase [Parerythrobacter lacustris]MCR2835020.1 alpha/beta hydrolase [Parerythrobacter lacustris]
MKRLLKIVGVLAAVLVVAFFVLRTPDTDPVEMRAKYGAAPSQFVELPNGAKVHLRDEGPRDAPAIILLHGSNSDLHTWQPWVDGLKADYRVIRFDQPGHGLTGAIPGGDYSIPTYVETIDEVADALGLERFILGGNSMGGGHTLHYALAHPERVQAMILVDASGPPRMQSADKDEGGNIGFTIAPTPVLNQLMKHITPRSVVEQSLSQSVSNQAIVTSQAVDRYWELLRYPGNREATIFRFSQDYEPLTEAQLSGLAMPALILWGEEDRLIPLSAGQWLNEKLPDAEFHALKGIGHLPMEEAPEDSLAALRGWLVEGGFTKTTGN